MSFGSLLALVPALTVLATLAGSAVGSPWLLPVLDALPAWPAMVALLRRGRRGQAVIAMLWWALWLALAAGALTALWPARAESVILNAAGYRDEMHAWLATGQGRESDPVRFLPQHLAHAVVFCATALLTAGAAALVMGASLMNYMTFYVVDLVIRCRDAPEGTLAVLLAWNPWSAARVVSFVVLGVVLSEPLLALRPGDWPRASTRWRWAAGAAAGLVIDAALKTLLAPRWPALIGGCLG